MTQNTEKRISSFSSFISSSIIRIVVIGSPSCGKTSLLNMWICGKMNTTQQSVENNNFDPKTGFKMSKCTFNLQGKIFNLEFEDGSEWCRAYYESNTLKQQEYEQNLSPLSNASGIFL